MELIKGTLQIFIPVEKPSLEVENILSSDSEFNFLQYLVQLQNRQPLFILRNESAPQRIQICLQDSLPVS